MPFIRLWLLCRNFIIILAHFFAYLCLINSVNSVSIK
jgi:hypothetical protein